MDVDKKQHEVHSDSKNPVGRPTDYLPEYCDKVTEYMSNCKLEGEIPTYAGMANYIRTTKQTLQNWKAKYPEFFASLSEMVQEQQQMLINKGLSGDYNSTIAKLMLSANHGMSERNITEHEGLEAIKPVINVHLTGDTDGQQQNS